MRASLSGQGLLPRSGIHRETIAAEYDRHDGLVHRLRVRRCTTTAVGCGRSGGRNAGFLRPVEHDLRVARVNDNHAVMVSSASQGAGRRSLAQHSMPADEMLAFAHRWYRHGGGPPAEIIARFGIDASSFFGVLLGHLDHVPATAFDPAELEEMKRVARKRIWLGC